MPPGLLILGLVVGLGLLVWWVLSLRRLARTASAQAVEWDAGSGAAEIWTTAARCPECRGRGATLQRTPQGLLHTCMACGHQHERRTLG
ncbi:hypothetical protein [Euzebya tangerina]|uniref:hypothetical protein n=1 Tax=Euzebya tangerina TaxID=591198 RepID=UPI000E324EFD|nr:hypothetical protein [Euzebya tangerina]